MFGLNPWVILAATFIFLGAVSGAYLKGHSNGVDTTTAKYEAALAKQRDEANAMLLASKDAALTKEREYNALKDKVEKENVEANTRINGLRIANGRLVAAAGGLFDRNGRPRGPSGGDGSSADSPAPGVSAGPAAGCSLSQQITDDLLDLARDADAVLNVARTCRAWALGIVQ